MSPQAGEVGTGGLIPAPGLLLEQAGLQFFLLSGAEVLLDCQRADRQPRVGQALPALTSHRAVGPAATEPAQLVDGPEPATELNGIAGIEEIAGRDRVVVAQKSP